MSKASKNVDWCLKKAEKHLAKAEHYLEVTEYLIKGKFSDISLGTLFYTMY